MAEVSPSLSVITLKVNELNSSIKRQRLAKWIFLKTTIQLHAVYKRSNFDPNTQIGQSERLEEKFHANSKQKEI